MSTTTKLPPCCARRQSQITHDKGALRAAARSAARAPESQRRRDAIATAKAQLEVSRQAAIEHDAQHAEGGL